MRPLPPSKRGSCQPFTLRFSRKNASSSRSRARGERVGHTDPAATSRRCALCSRTCRPRQSFAAPAGSARLAAGRVTSSPTYSPRYAPHPLSLPQAPLSIRPWRGSNETLCGLSTIPRTIKRRLLNAKRRPGTEGSEITPGLGSGRR
jgi:hypothetical protein